MTNFMLKNIIIKRETAKAMLIHFDIEDEGMLIDKEEWFPISQIKSMGSQYIEVSNWIAQQKGLVA